MKVLLDTNVISETRRSQPDPRVLARLASTPPEDKFLSVVTVGEVTAGIGRIPVGKRRRELEEWLAEAERDFAARILPVDVETARVWGEVTARAAIAGRVVQPADGLIAATAIRHGLHVMTRNTKDFQPTGALLIDPWQP